MSGRADLFAQKSAITVGVMNAYNAVLRASLTRNRPVPEWVLEALENTQADAVADELAALHALQEWGDW